MEINDSVKEYLKKYWNMDISDFKALCEEQSINFDNLECSSLSELYSNVDEILSMPKKKKMLFTY